MEELTWSSSSRDQTQTHRGASHLNILILLRVLHPAPPPAGGVDLLWENTGRWRMFVCIYIRDVLAVRAEQLHRAAAEQTASEVIVPELGALSASSPQAELLHPSVSLPVCLSDGGGALRRRPDQKL